jgi:hypothetical protein
LDWGSGALNIIVNQLATRYARVTEKVAADALNATTATEILPPTGGTGGDVLGFLYGAAEQVYGALGVLGNIAFVSMDIWAAWGSMTDLQGRPLFSAGSPSNDLGSATPTTFTMVVGGFPVVVSHALPPGTAIVTARSNVELYEQRIGTLSVTEPSVLGMQVAYAGYFSAYIPKLAGVVKASATATQQAQAAPAKAAS